MQQLSAAAAGAALAPVHGTFRAGVAEEFLAGAEDKTALGVPAVAAECVFLDGALGFVDRPSEAQKKGVQGPLAIGVRRRFIGSRQAGHHSQAYDYGQQAPRPHSMAHFTTLRIDEDMSAVVFIGTKSGLRAWIVE
jgi:hypothetical protein